MTKKLVYLLVTLSLALQLNAQMPDSTPLVIVGNDTATLGDFKYLYNKNVQQTKTLISEQSPKDYLDMYINFRMKVLYAQEKGLDTMDYIRKELNTYRVQAAEPYMLDSSLKEQLVQEAYEHMQYDLRASHILIFLSQDAEPKDTLSAYKKAMEARGKILDGEDFAKVAFEYSDEIKPRAKQLGVKEPVGTEGDLFYFSAFAMVYPFEKAVYSLNVGEVSMPVRTQFGYHIIKLTEKHPAIGKSVAAHIFIPNTDSKLLQDSGVDYSKLSIDSAYAELQAGESFENVARRYSKDPRTAENGGLLAEFTIETMTPFYLENFYKLKDGEYSKIIQTPYGWHILKRLSASGRDAIGREREAIEMKMNKDKLYRAVLPISSHAQRLMKENGFKDNIANYNAIKKHISAKNTIKDGKWEFDSTNPIYKKHLFTYNKKNASLADFARYIKKSQKPTSREKSAYIDYLYQEYKTTFVITDAIETLDQKDADFAALMKEYSDGILLFEVMNENVWAKASLDTVGLDEYFNAHRADYMTEEKLDAIIISYDVRNVKTDKIRKWINKAYASNLRKLDELQASAEKKFGLGKVDFKEGVFAKEDDIFIANTPWQVGLSSDIASGETTKAFVLVKEIVAKTFKDFASVKGSVITDYQDYLDKEWIKELRSRYKVEINQEALNALSK